MSEVRNNKSRTRVIWKKISIKTAPFSPMDGNRKVPTILAPGNPNS